MNYTDIILKPSITEKLNHLRETDPSVVQFYVHPSANKIQIAEAVSKMFKVKVKTVRTLNVKGKEKRQGKFTGFRPDRKKAIVVLEKDQKIEIFEGL